jgi:hypothetical protein
VNGAIVTPSFASSPWIRRCPHSGFSRARRSTSRLIPARVGGRPGVRRLLVSYFFTASLRCQARIVAGQTGRRQASACAARAVPARRTTPGRPARTAPGLPEQHRVLMPEHQQFSVLRPAATEQQDDQADNPALQHVGDLERHSSSQAPPVQPVGGSAGQQPNRVFERHRIRLPPVYREGEYPRNGRTSSPNRQSSSHPPPNRRRGWPPHGPSHHRPRTWCSCSPATL